MNQASNLAVSDQRFAAGLDQSVPRPAQVEDQLKGLQVIADDLSVMVTCLTARLTSVIQPTLPTPTTQSGGPEEVLVPLANEIRTVRKSINESLNQLRELNGRIELTA